MSTSRAGAIALHLHDREDFSKIALNLPTAALPHARSLADMSPVSAIALSGMNAAMLRLNASARNIANVRSNGPLPGAAQAGDYPPAYTPVDVVQISRAGGGV